MKVVYNILNSGSEELGSTVPVQEKELAVAA
jgi:hypothetical protein